MRAGLPFTGLREHSHDEALDAIVPPAAARASRALPLCADDERIRVAVADPQADLSALTPHLGDRRLELAIASAAELDAVLGPPEPEPEPDEPAPIVADPEPEPKPGLEAVVPPPVASQPPAARRGRRVWLAVAIVVVLVVAVAIVLALTAS